MKKSLYILCVLLIAFGYAYPQYAPVPKNNTQPAPAVHYSGTTVIVGFSIYDNKGLAGQLVSENNGVIDIVFPDDQVTCTIDNKGNVLEGKDYFTQKGAGKPIAFIQIYETKKKIVNPDLDRNKTLGNFMLVELSSGNIIFGNADYNAADKSFLLYAKPSSKQIKLKPQGRLWKVTYSDDPRINTAAAVTAVYLYTSATRRFYTANSNNHHEDH